MTRTLSIFLLFLHALVVFKPFSPYLEYMVSYDYIVNVLCINKDKPELACNGSCHLTAELKNAMEEEQQQPLNNSSRLTVKLNVFIQTTYNIPALTNQTTEDGHLIARDERITGNYNGEPSTPPPKV